MEGVTRALRSAGVLLQLIPRVSGTVSRVPGCSGYWDGPGPILNMATVTSCR